MAQPRPSRAQVTGRSAAVVLLAAAAAGTPGIPPFDHITPAAGGLPVFLACPVACAAAAAFLSVPARFIQPFTVLSQRISGVRRGSRAHMPAVAPAPYASRWFWLQTIAFGDSRLHHRHRYVTYVA
jgi:hypothetical protein